MAPLPALLWPSSWLVGWGEGTELARLKEGARRSQLAHPSLVALLVLLVILIFRERQGRAMFMPLASKEEADIDLSAGQPYSESASMTVRRRACNTTQAKIDPFLSGLSLSLSL